MSEKPAAVIILAAGQGTRMRSSVPKVLHTIGGRSLLGHVIHAARGTGPEHIAVVVRHDREAVAAHAREADPDVVIAEQDEVPGTGRAAWAAMQALPRDLTGPILVLASDVPLLDTPTLDALLGAHDGGVTILSSIIPDATGYGRVIRDDTGAVTGIVEHRDATEEERLVREINSAVYAFDAALLRSALEEVGTDNAQGEMYLTDVIAIARDRGEPVTALVSDDPIVAEGVNDKVQLAAMGKELNMRVLTAWMRSGVTIVDPGTTWIDVTVELQADVTILPGTHLHGTTTVATGAVVGPDTTLHNAAVGERASVVRSHVLDSVIGPEASVGPYSYLRQHTVMERGAKIGTFAESKNSHLGAGSKLPHLAYLGDAEVGEGSNIGAGTITANYDGVHKYATTIGAHARVGSGNMLVPPITIGDGAYSGAGTTLREDVPPGALAVPQAGGDPVGQRHLKGWTIEKRPGTPSALAAQEALQQRDTPPQDSDDSPNPQQERSR